MTLDQIRAAANPVKVDAAALAARVRLPRQSPNVPAAAARLLVRLLSTASTAPGTAAAATPGKAAGKGKGAATGGTAGAAPQQASAAVPEAPVLAAPDAVAQQANDGLLINGSVNNAATSQYALSQAFGNNRSGRSLYTGGFSLVSGQLGLGRQQVFRQRLHCAQPCV